MTPYTNTPALPKQTGGIWAYGMAGICLVIVLLSLPAPAAAGNWNVAVGVSGGNGYRPIAYGPGYGAPYGPGFRRGYWNGGPYGYGGWGNGWNGGWATGWAYPAYPYVYSPPPAVYVQPVLVEPVVLAAQAQPPVWYFCASAAQYFPNVGGCPEGWQVQPAVPPLQTQSQQKPSNPARTN